MRFSRLQRPRWRGLLVFVGLLACAEAPTSKPERPAPAITAAPSPPAAPAAALPESAERPDTSYLKPTDLKAEYQAYDFSGLWQHDDDRNVVGFIGAEYERLRIVLLRVRQDEREPDLYQVTGKSKVKGTVCAFAGTIRLAHVWAMKDSVLQEEGDPETLEYLAKRGEVVGTYTFREAGTGAHIGVFSGTVRSSWLLTKDHHIRYDDLQAGYDGYSNNQFTGQWRSNDGQLHYPANWGDYRIPNAGPLDVGAGEFMPDERYARNGWASYREAMQSADERGWEQERAPWW